MRNIMILTALAALAVLGDNADAVVGRPLTPVSYAGVARRTARRSAGTAVVAPVPVAPVHAAVAPVAVLPGGCGRTMVGPTVYYRCGAAYYQPQYSGPNVVYVPVAAP